MIPIEVNYTPHEKNVLEGVKRDLREHIPALMEKIKNANGEHLSYEKVTNLDCLFFVTSLRKYCNTVADIKLVYGWAGMSSDWVYDDPFRFKFLRMNSFFECYVDSLKYKTFIYKILVNLKLIAIEEEKNKNIS